MAERLISAKTRENEEEIDAEAPLMKHLPYPIRRGLTKVLEQHHQHGDRPQAVQRGNVSRHEVCGSAGWSCLRHKRFEAVVLRS